MKTLSERCVRWLVGQTVHDVVHCVFAPQAGNASSESLSESDSRSTGGSALLDALSLSDAATVAAGAATAAANKLEHDPRLAPHLPHLPHILDTCFKHIESHGE